MGINKLKLLLLLSVAPMWTACGMFEGRLERDYSIYIQSDNQAMTSEIVRTIHKFNSHFGKNILSYEPDKSKAGSVVKLEHGIKQRDDKVGWANYRVVRTLTNGVTTGNVRLDYDFVKENSEGKQEPSIKLFTLFSHEWGHVFGLGHTLKSQQNSLNQVMYESINEESKDFRNHFHLLTQAYDRDSPEDVIYGTYDN